MTVIATGGLASLVIDEVPIIDAHEPWLTLIGLRLVWERNAAIVRGEEPPHPASRHRTRTVDAVTEGDPR